MSSHATSIFTAAMLLLLTQHAAAQAWLPNSTSQQSPDKYPAPIAWPELHAHTTQTWVGIRHNNTDGTTLGVGVRTVAYPSMLLELEIVPPGYGPADKDKTSAPPQLPSDNPQLRTIHKLSLRYRF